jgi:aromatic ring-opening dioxygenase catalytic subunit (LigB family)
MGGIVFAAAMSHAPHITGYANHASKEVKDRVYAGMTEIGDQLRQARPDVLVVVSSDHFHNLFVDRMPAFCVGVAQSYSGPIEKWINVDSFSIPGAEAFSRALVEQAYEDGFDPAFAENVILEHGVVVPLQFLAPKYDIPLVPILQNCMVPPLPTLSRCYDFGQFIRRAAKASDLRVAVVGTGGLSHSPGAPEAGDIDREFDLEFLGALASERPVQVVDWSSEKIDAAGFGAWEIRQWVTALGAANGAQAQTVYYESVAEWETGCGGVVFETSTS